MVELLEKELSYKIQGCIFNVSNNYGKGLKEIIYQKALEEELKREGLNFESQKRINIYSFESGKVFGTYIPDFLIEGRVILEIKACTERLDIRRSIYTNDKKSFFKKINK